MDEDNLEKIKQNLEAIEDAMKNGNQDFTLPNEIPITPLYVRGVVDSYATWYYNTMHKDVFVIGKISEDGKIDVQIYEKP